MILLLINLIFHNLKRLIQLDYRQILNFNQDIKIDLNFVRFKFYFCCIILQVVLIHFKSYSNM